MVTEPEAEPSIESASARPPGARVRFGGRVTASDAAHARVEDATAALLVITSTAPPVGALVVVSGVRTEAGVRAEQLDVVGVAATAFPRAGGEVRAMTDHARRRANGLRARA